MPQRFLRLSSHRPAPLFSLHDSRGHLLFPLLERSRAIDLAPEGTNHCIHSLASLLRGSTHLDRQIDQEVHTRM